MLLALPNFPKATMTPIERTRIYVASIVLERVRLVILGKDAYPKGATGIAFCKDDWPALMAHNCSGRYVLEALGVNLSAESAVDQALPEQLFKRLAQAGVVFLNASYSEDVGKRFTKRANTGALTEAYALNKAVIKAAAKVIRCGEALRMDWVEHADKEQKYWDVVHPAQRNSTNRSGETKKSWWDIWGSPGSLAKDWSGEDSGIAILKPLDPRS